jgi:hypothetical protein
VLKRIQAQHISEFISGSLGGFYVIRKRSSGVQKLGHLFFGLDIKGEFVEDAFVEELRGG